MRLFVQLAGVESILVIWKTSFRRTINASIAEISLEDSGSGLSASYVNPRMSSVSDNSRSPVGKCDQWSFS